MKYARWLALICLVAMMVTTGCSSDDDDPVLGNGPATAVAETGLNETLNQVVDPVLEVVEFIEQTLLTLPPAPRAARGVATCPNTSGVCNPGSLTCQVVTGLDFDFDQCTVSGAGASITLDGDISVVPGIGTTTVAFGSLTIDNGPALSGTLILTASTCGVQVDLAKNDGTLVNGYLSGCGPYPSSGSALSIQLVTQVGLLLIDVYYDGSATAMATVWLDGEVVSNCTVDLDTLVGQCSPA